MKIRGMLYIIILFLMVIYSEATSSQLENCASLEGEINNLVLSINFDYSNCDTYLGSLIVFDSSGRNIYKIETITGGYQNLGYQKGSLSINLDESMLYHDIVIQLKGKTKSYVSGYDRLLAEQKIKSKQNSNINSDSNSIIDEIGTREGSKIYNLNNKEYIISCPYTSSGSADFTVNGERASERPGWDFMKPGEKWIFSDGSILTSLGVRRVEQDCRNCVRVLNYCKFKLESAPETVKQTCTSGWTCQENYKVYVSKDCFESNKEYCSYGCSNGQCLPPSCSMGWMCKNNNEKAYRNSDCSFSSTEYCPYGCTNGRCIPEQVTPTNNQPSGSSKQVCSAGWICKDSATRAYRNSDCIVSSETLCSYGCTNGMCKGSPSTGAAITDTTGKIECGTFCWIGRLFTAWFTG